MVSLPPLAANTAQAVLHIRPIISAQYGLPTEGMPLRPGPACKVVGLLTFGWASTPTEWPDKTSLLSCAAPRGHWAHYRLKRQIVTYNPPEGLVPYQYAMPSGLLAGCCLCALAQGSCYWSVSDGPHHHCFHRVSDSAHVGSRLHFRSFQFPCMSKHTHQRQQRQRIARRTRVGALGAAGARRMQRRSRLGDGAGLACQGVSLSQRGRAADPCGGVRPAIAQNIGQATPPHQPST